MQNQLSLLETLTTAPNSLLLNLVARLAQAGSINEHHRQPADVGSFLDRISCRARDGRNDRSVAAKQLVQQARFAGVGTPDDRGANATPQNLAFISGAKQLVHEAYAFLQPSQELFASIR